MIFGKNPIKYPFQLWSESIKFPHTCDYCTEGCQCDSPYGLSRSRRDYKGESIECDYCQYDHNRGCDAADWEPDEGQTEDDAPECECECRCCFCDCDCASLAIDADSYNKWIKETCYICPPSCLTKTYLKDKSESLLCRKKIGTFEFYVKVLPTHTTVFGGFFGLTMERVRTELSVYEENKINSAYFSGPVFIPMIVKKETNGLGQTKDRVWMSLTPMEVLSQREAIPLAKGRTLIAGLGMGWLTQRVLENPAVDHVTQVELEPEIIEFFGSPLKDTYGDRIEFVGTNIWDYLSIIDIKKFDTILFDIWPSYFDAKRDKKFQDLKRRCYKAGVEIWGWGDYSEEG